MSSGALAQNCSPPFFITVGRFQVNVTSQVASGVSAASAIVGSIDAVNTAFLTQSGAFVSAPPNPQPNSQGGGVWTRGVGGQATIKSNSTVSANTLGLGGLGGAPPPNVLLGSGSFNCSTQFHQDFGGFQFGSDVAKLNVLGWNLHLGTTAGYVESKGAINGGSLSLSPFNSFDSTTAAPFVGTYAVATNGGFFIDGLVRYDLYETTMESPSVNIFSQKVDAHSINIGGSLGYNWAFPNSTWFIEPSIGIIQSRVSIDPINLAGIGKTLVGPTFGGTLQIQDYNSTIGRAGLRIGTTVDFGSVIVQPFASASIWKDFGDSIRGNFATCTDCGLVGVSANSSFSTQNIGRYGQYSLGANGQITNTGWLGFARLDYRDGNRLVGLSGTGGLRYQFTPGALGPMDMAFAMADNALAYVKSKKAPVFATKAPPRMVEHPYNWTGWYVGAFGGADYGKSHMAFTGLGLVTDTGPRIGGALLGGQFGYNYQFGSWVLGAEGDLGWTNASGSTPCAPLPSGINLPPNPPLFNMTCHDQADSIATAAARLGYPWGRALLYAKIGAAWIHESFSATCNLGPLNGVPPSINCGNSVGVISSMFSGGDTRTGWTAGWGVEFALTPSWSAKGEFDYMDFGNRNVTASDGSIINAGMRISEVKVGINYHFNH